MTRRISRDAAARVDHLANVVRTERIMAGALLVLILLLIPPGALLVLALVPVEVVNMPLEQKLRTIAEHALGWRVLNAGFMVLLVLSSLGLAALARQLRRSDAGVIGDLALVAYVMGALLFIIELAFRVSGMVLGAEETVRAGSVPDWMVSLTAWGYALFIVYTVLSNVGGLGFGVALLRTDIVPAWAGWLTVATSLAALANLVVTGDNAPFQNLIGPMAIGIALLLPRSQRIDAIVPEGAGVEADM